jgi:uncharacterized protein YjdB
VVTTIAVEGVPPGSSPTSSNITVGATRQLRAIVRDQYGTEMQNQAVTWSTSNGSFATVSNGLVTGMGVGVAVITARSTSNTNLFGTHTVNVQPAASAVAEIHIAPNYQSWGTGPLPTQFIAVVRAADGSNITSQYPVTWSSSNNAVATVDQQGNATGVAAGGALITATAGGKSMSGAVSIGARGSISMEVYLGTVAGDVAAYGAQLQAFQNGTLVGTGVVNQTGRGYVPGLLAGTYSVTVSLPGYASQTINNITVAINSATPVPPIALVPNSP